MTSINSEKNALRQAINQWHGASVGEPSVRAWSAIEDAILALDNAAYERAFQLAGAGEALRGMQAEIEDLVTERDLARTKFKREATDAGRLARECTAARAELADARETIKRLGYQLNQVSRSYARGAEYHAQSRGEELDRLRKALETLADRYHAQMCYKNRRYPHSRKSCPYVLAVQDANEALAGDLKFFKTDDEQLNEAERQRSERVRIEQNVVGSPHVARQVGEEAFDRGSFVGPDAGLTRTGRKYPEPAAADDLRTLEREVAGLGSALSFDDGALDSRVTKLEKQHDGLPVRDHVTQRDRPDEEPDIEAVLIGSREIQCADGCGRVVKQGSTMYRHVTHVLAVRPLYATKECARRYAARSGAL